MGVGEGGQNPPQTEHPLWSRLWSVVVFRLVLVEVIVFSDSLDSPDGAGSLDGRRPLILVASGVLAVPVLAAVQAKWGKTRVFRMQGSRGWGSAAVRYGSSMRPPVLRPSALSSTPTRASDLLLGTSRFMC